MTSAETAWIVPSNPRTFRADDAFQQLPEIDWSEVANAHIEVGDTVLLYTTSPVQALTHVCLVVRTGVTFSEVIDDAHFWADPGEFQAREARTWMRLRLVRALDGAEREACSLSTLQTVGLARAPQGRWRAPADLLTHLDSVLRMRRLNDDSSAEAAESTVAETDHFSALINAGAYAVPDAHTTVKTRGSAQRAFAKRVKGNYGYRCAITGISTPDFLVASHIVPWSADQTIRLDPRNGICLSTLVDRAFDSGYLTIGEDLVVRVAAEQLAHDPHLLAALASFDGTSIALPSREAPVPAYLRRRSHGA